MDASTLDPLSLAFGTPYTQNNGQRIIPVSTNKDRFEFDTRLRMQLGKDENCMLVSDFGVNTPMPGQDPSRLNLDLNLTPELEATLKRFDEHVCKTASENAQAFFKMATLSKQYQPIVRYNKKTNAPYIRVKVVVADRINKTEIRVLQGGNQTILRPHTDIGRNSHVLAVVETPGIWSNHAEFGVSFTARGILARTAPPSNGLSLFSLSTPMTDVSEEVPAVAMEEERAAM